MFGHNKTLEKLLYIQETTMKRTTSEISRQGLNSFYMVSRPGRNSLYEVSRAGRKSLYVQFEK